MRTTITSSATKGCWCITSVPRPYSMVPASSLHQAELSFPFLRVPWGPHQYSVRLVATKLGSGLLAARAEQTDRSTPFALWIQHPQGELAPDMRMGTQCMRMVSGKGHRPSIHTPGEHYVLTKPTSLVTEYEKST
jgi:hypothetical protein